MSKFKHKKAIQAINLLAVLSGGSESKLKLAKLLWLADRLHLRKYGRPITYDQYCALPHGPVPSATLTLINANFEFISDADQIVYRNKFIGLDEVNNSVVYSKEDPDLMVLSDSDEKAIREVFQTFRGYSASDLRNISHDYPEWSRWEESIENPALGRSFNMDYADFFLNPAKGDLASGNVPEDVLALNRGAFREAEEIRNLLS